MLPNSTMRFSIMISLVSVLCQCNGVFSYSVAVSIISRGHQSTGKKHQVTGKLYHIFFLSEYISSWVGFELTRKWW